MLEHDVKSIAHLIFSAVESPVAARCREVLNSNDPAGFGAISVDPRRYADSESYFRDIQCVSFLKKFDDGLLKKDLEEKAKNQFHACERQCALTNLRLSDFLHNTAFHDGKEERLWRYLQRCKELLRAWLGPIPTDLNPRFGPGATFSDKGRSSTIMDKMSSRPSCTPSCVCMLDLWTRTSWFRGLAYELPHKSDPEIVKGNRFTTVPKDATKRRNIAVEPSINIFYQLGAGRVLRTRLKRLGIDLNEGQTTHRTLARYASQTGEYATLDLSNASDTIARRLVELLLPREWFELLNTLRSPMTLMDGKWYWLEKFSSMGNGFTFELETLIFLVLLAALDPEITPGENLFVYGDDIILPSRYAKSAVSALEWAGFSLNETKSFVDGEFRESCGGDYFKGRAVRPCFLKEAPSHPTDWIALANSLWRTAVETYWSGDYELAEHCDSYADVLGWLTPAWAYCISRLPNRLRVLRGPHQLGDTLIHSLRRDWKAKWRNGIRYFVGLVPRSRKRPLSRYPGSVALAALVYGVPSTGVSPRGAPFKIHHTEVPFS